MPDLVDAFRAHAAANPLILTVILGGAAWLALRVSGSLAQRVPAAIAGVALVALGVYAALAVWYAGDPRYFDAAEPTIPIIGWLAMLGQPIYHDPAAAERYAHIYGPLAFLAHGAVLTIAGPGIEASKWLGVGAALASLGATYAALAGTTSRARALVLTGGCALVYLGFRNYSFWTRPEPLLLLAAAGGLVAAVRARGLAAGIGVGLAAGVLVNLKITGALYALPLVTLLAVRLGVGPVLLALATGAVTAGLPFLLPNVSLRAYLDWLSLSARNGLLVAPLRQNLEWCAWLLLPIAIARVGRGVGSASARGVWPVTATIVFGVLATAIAAAKPGAGSYHLLPFVPAIAWVLAGAMSSGDPLAGDRLAPPVAAAWIAAAVLIAVAQQISFVRVLTEGERAARDDVRAWLAAHPGETAQMAYSGYDRPTFARPDLTFRSGLYLIDGPAVQEHQLSGLAVPPATLAAIRACRADVWLAPRDTEPFAGPNRYPAMARAALFPDAFRRAFAESYVRESQTRFYDVWRCRSRRQP